MKIGNRLVGDGHPTYVIAEIGINHNGDIEIARQMINAAVHAGVDAVKFQKRTPEVCTPPEQQKKMRQTPWGYITYLDYRYKVEFGQDEYREIDRYCKEKGCVLDPTAGSFNSIVAAKELGLKGIGIEKDRSFFWKAVAKIEKSADKK